MNMENRIFTGDCARVLKTLPDKSVDCCVTSPPYYGLRDYGVSGQIGLEETPELYISRLVEVFMEVYRALKPAGSLWLNIGDSYWGGKGYSGSSAGVYQYERRKEGKSLTREYSNFGGKGTIRPTDRKHEYIKTKDLIGIPWMLAFELRRAGFYLRQDIIWHKPNPMPESVRDRCTKSHEYIFLLAKSAKYYFDHEAILEPAAYDGRKDTAFKGSDKYAEETAGLNVQAFASKGHERWPAKIRGFAGKEGKTGLFPVRHDSGVPACPARNKRDVWSVCVKTEKERHFAVFPDTLIIDCVKAGCPENGIVLDPFIGSGTTAIVAKKLGRKYIGCEINPEYARMAERRIAEINPLFEGAL
jgi:DNA modification methylase